jgi:hypothetical protein
VGGYAPWPINRIDQVPPWNLGVRLQTGRENRRIADQRVRCRFRIMSTKNTITVVLLWISVIVWSIWFGGTIYQMLVIEPIWSDSLPQSLYGFFKGTSWNHNVLHFFGP